MFFTLVCLELGKQYCFGFQDAAKQDDGFKDMFLLGGLHCSPKENSLFKFIFFVVKPLPCFISDMVLSNKLVVYDMEKIVIGWTEYNYKIQLIHICSIKCYIIRTN